MTNLRKAHLIEGYGLTEKLRRFGPDGSTAFPSRAMWLMSAPTTLDWKRKPTILNGPRPFPADTNWTGPFLSGVFWGAVYEDSPDRDFCLERARQLDIAQIVFHTVTHVWVWAKEHYAQYDIDPSTFPYQDVATAYWNHLYEEAR